jgi:hypothetical protein
MRALAPFRAVGWAAGVLGSQKSFKANPILGSPALNRRGLHRRRVALAAAMAERRRRAMAARLEPADREAFDRDGFVVKPDFLGDGLHRLREAILARPLPAREMRQGRTVTRMSPLDQVPEARAVALRPDLRRLMGYAAGRGGEPVLFIQTVIADPSRGGADPQTAMHADTFHATAKCWLFLCDVGEEDGPFVFVPGSHRLTPERLDWEHRQSLVAVEEGGHHALGSFRIVPERLPALGYDRPPRRVAVKAGTLVVADTYGFHHRAPSARPTTRLELHGHIRRNPFLPWNGLDPLALPGLRGRQIALFHRWLALSERRGRAGIWKDAGPVTADAPARV